METVSAPGEQGVSKMIITTPTGRYEISPLYTFKSADGFIGTCILSCDADARAIADIDVIDRIINKGRAKRAVTVTVTNEMTGTIVWSDEEGQVK